MSQFMHLFSQINIGTMNLKNRMIMAPMQTNYADEKGHVTNQHIAYHVVRAKGGVAYNTTGQTTVAFQGRYNGRMLCLHDDKFVPGFKRLADAVHSAGGKLVIQLNHCGPKADPEATGMPVVGPSPIEDNPKSGVPIEISERGIQDTVSDFARAALGAKNAGIDGIELHMAHGYLLSSFLTKHMNKRNDAYGGDIHGRMRFSLEVLMKVRETVGERYPIICRFSMGDFKNTGISLEDAVVLAKALEKTGANALHISAYKDATAPYYTSQGHLIPYATEVKKVVNIPVIGVGRILDPVYAERLLSEGQVDIVALGRQMLADPEFPNKIRDGRLDEIIPCIGCNSGCIGRTITYHTTCVSNPQTGYEAVIRIKPAEKKKKVMVIGGGPAGIQTALTAAERGHQVTLFEKRDYLGGNFYVASLPDGKKDLLRLLTYWECALTRNHIDIRLNTKATVETIQSERPDEVVAAIGATSYYPPIKGIDTPMVIRAEDVFFKESEIGTNVVVAGGGEVGLEVADHLARNGKSVVLVEMQEAVGYDVPKNTKPVLLKRLKEAEVSIRTQTTLKRIGEGSVMVEANGEESVIDTIDNVVLALGFRPNHGVLKRLRSAFSSIHIIGDAMDVRQAFSAVQDGFKLGCSL